MSDIYMSLAGNVGSDAVAGEKAVYFRVAVNKTGKNYEDTIWFTVYSYIRNEKHKEYLLDISKGDMITARGSYAFEMYNDNPQHKLFADKIIKIKKSSNKSKYDRFGELIEDTDEYKNRYKANEENEAATKNKQTSFVEDDINF